MVEYPGAPGIGRVSEIDGATVTIDYFESVAEPVAESRRVAAEVCRPVKLQNQTRVYRQDPDTGAWRAGRIVGGDQAAYFVRFPNAALDSKVPEAQLRVRWDRPVRNPVDVLVAGANESGYYCQCPAADAAQLGCATRGERECVHAPVVQRRNLPAPGSRRHDGHR